MAGLTGMAGGASGPGDQLIARARQAWEESMLQRVAELQAEIRQRDPSQIARRTGGKFQEGMIELDYWGRPVLVGWPDLQARWGDDSAPCSTFDTAILTYYLHTADGTTPTGHWISFRELPDGGFYHQAFQGYSGDRLAHAFGESPAAFATAAQALGGRPILSLSEHAFAFSPLPGALLAAVLWPGDEEFPTRASVLFDSAASRYLPTDGLALLGSGLASRLLK